MVADRGLAYAELLRLRNEYKEYREAHWDAEHNYIRPEYAEGLYEIFREGIVARRIYDGIMKGLMPKEPKAIQAELDFNTTTGNEGIIGRYGL